MNTFAFQLPLWRRRFVAVAPALFLAVMCVSGCGGTDKPGGTVSGKVTVGGKPAAVGTMVIFAGANNARVTGAVAKADGSYTISDAPEGDVKVGVQGTPPIPKGGLSPSGDSAPPPGESVPAKYADPNTSGLSTTVKHGPQTYDIPLTP